MMLTANQTKRVDIPHEPGEWAEIRMLSWKQRNEAEQNKLAQMMEQVKALGGFETVKDMRNLRGETEQQAQDDNPLNSYDALTCLRYGLLGLSYVEGSVTPEITEDLDGDTVEFLAREIIEYSARKSEEGKGSRRK